ncbi:hypothetical protein [Aureliella helgolandensis]|nr:hypothetical protein [Aureliella helgolandensis]
MTHLQNEQYRLLSDGEFTCPSSIIGALFGLNLMSVADQKGLVLKANRLRFFATTAWGSLTIGLLVFAFTEWLGIPYGWAVFLVVIRALVWAIAIEIDRLDIRIDANSVTGPSMLFTSKPETLSLAKIESDKIFELLGIFFIEDSTRKEIVGHYTYYSREDQKRLREFIRRLR